MRKYEKWLGHWKPEYDSITSENEIVLMVNPSSRELSIARHAHGFGHAGYDWNCGQPDFARFVTYVAECRQSGFLCELLLSGLPAGQVFVPLAFGVF